MESEQELMQGFVEVRLFVYRVILSNLEDEAKGNILVKGALILSYPLICSPKVSITISEYLATRSALAEEVQKTKRELIRQNPSLSSLFDNFLYDLKQAPKIQSINSKNLETIARAMCADLDVDMGKLRETNQKSPLPEPEQ